MKLINKTGPLYRRFGIEKAVDMLIDAGFDAIDFTFVDECFEEQLWDKPVYEELRKRAEARGVCFHQAHAPAPSSYKEEEAAEKMFLSIVETMRRASWLGVRNIVVHPCQHLYYVEKGVPEQLFEYNMKFFRRLIPYCEEFGIRVAIENMWQYPGMISHSTCSKPEEMIRYIDELNHECILGCLDVGHAVLVREKPDDFIRMLGNKRLACMHIHDVDGIRDSHTLPYFGIGKWQELMTALAEIGYEGDFTYETDGFFEKIPDALLPASLKFAEETGRYLISLFEEAKKK